MALRGHYVIMYSVRKKKSYALPVLIALIVSCFAFMVFALRNTNAEEEETVSEPKNVLVSKPCETKDHYKVYLGVNEIYMLDDTGYKSEDESIASVRSNRVYGWKVGKTVLSKDCNSYEVEVTDMITAPAFSFDKPFLTCDIYSNEDNAYLDEILATKVKDRGYATRAGVVQAARFLLLQFPYRLNYFNENGRLPYCDGEGRYYHQGLYLSESKFDSISASVAGKAPWGCSLTSFPYGGYLRNSMDCSGFVSWCLVNGGFDPGDLGSGPSPNVDDLSDLGEKHPITMESLEDIKVGDLLSANGHIALLIGKKDGIYYVGESNMGVHIRVKEYDAQGMLNSTFRNYVDMDEFYGYRDGKMSQYWNENIYIED